MSKRIAIQLFGYLRSFRKTYKSFIKNIVEINEKNGYEVDVFVHTWRETEHSGKEVTDTNEIYTYYRAKRVLIEKQFEVVDYSCGMKVSTRILTNTALLNVSYSIYKSSELRHEYTKDTGIKYDYVIVTRPDILFRYEFSIDAILHPYKKYNMDISPNALFFAGYVLAGGGIVNDKHFNIFSDILYFGTENAIDKSTAFYLTLSCKNFDANKFFKDVYSPEYLLYEHWISKNIEPIQIKYIYGSAFLIIRTVKSGGKLLPKSIINFIKQVIKLCMPYGIVMKLQNIRERMMLSHSK